MKKFSLSSHVLRNDHGNEAIQTVSILAVAATVLIGLLNVGQLVQNRSREKVETVLAGTSDSGAFEADNYSPRDITASAPSTYAGTTGALSSDEPTRRIASNKVGRAVAGFDSAVPVGGTPVVTPPVGPEPGHEPGTEGPMAGNPVIDPAVKPEPVIDPPAKPDPCTPITGGGDPNKPGDPLSIDPSEGGPANENPCEEVPPSKKPPVKTPTTPVPATGSAITGGSAGNASGGGGAVNGAGDPSGSGAGNDGSGFPSGGNNGSDFQNSGFGNQSGYPQYGQNGGGYPMSGYPNNGVSNNGYPGGTQGNDDANNPASRKKQSSNESSDNAAEESDETDSEINKTKKDTRKQKSGRASQESGENTKSPAANSDNSLGAVSKFFQGNKQETSDSASDMDQSANLSSQNALNDEHSSDVFDEDNNLDAEEKQLPDIRDADFDEIVVIDIDRTEPQNPRLIVKVDVDFDQIQLRIGKHHLAFKAPPAGSTSTIPLAAHLVKPGNEIKVIGVIGASQLVALYEVPHPGSPKSEMTVTKDEQQSPKHGEE